MFLNVSRRLLTSKVSRRVPQRRLSSKWQHPRRHKVMRTRAAGRPSRHNIPQQPLADAPRRLLNKFHKRLGAAWSESGFPLAAEANKFVLKHNLACCGNECVSPGWLSCKEAVRRAGWRAAERHVKELLPEVLMTVHGMLCYSSLAQLSLQVPAFKVASEAPDRNNS